MVLYRGSFNASTAAHNVAAPLHRAIDKRRTGAARDDGFAAAGVRAAAAAAATVDAWEVVEGTLSPRVSCGRSCADGLIRRFLRKKLPTTLRRHRLSSVRGERAGAYAWPVHAFDTATAALKRRDYERARDLLARHVERLPPARVLEQGSADPGVWRTRDVNEYTPEKLVQGGSTSYGVVALCRPALSGPPDTPPSSAALRWEPATPSEEAAQRIDALELQESAACRCVIKMARLSEMTGDTAATRKQAAQRELNAAVHFGNTMAASRAGPIGPRVLDAWYVSGHRAPVVAICMQQFMFNGHEAIKRLSDCGGLRPFDPCGSAGLAEGRVAPGSAMADVDWVPDATRLRASSFALVRVIEKALGAQLRRLVDEELVFGDAKLPNVVLDLCEGPSGNVNLRRLVLSDFGGDFLMSTSANVGPSEAVDVALAHAMCFASLAANAASSQPCALSEERVVPHDDLGVELADEVAPRDARVLFAAPLAALCALALSDERMRGRVGSEWVPCCAEHRLNQLGGASAMMPTTEYVVRRVAALLVGFVEHLHHRDKRTDQGPSHAYGQAVLLGLGVATALSGEGLPAEACVLSSHVSEACKLCNFAFDEGSGAPQAEVYTELEPYRAKMRRLTTSVLQRALGRCRGSRSPDGSSCFVELLLVWRLFDVLFARKEWNEFAASAPSAWLEHTDALVAVGAGVTALVQPPALSSEMDESALSCAHAVQTHVRRALDACKADSAARAATIDTIARECGLAPESDSPCLSSQLRAAVATLDLDAYLAVVDEATPP